MKVQCYWCVLFHVHFRDGWTWIFRTPIDQTRSVNCTLFETKMWHATLPFLFWIFLFKFNFLINFYQFFWNFYWIFLSNSFLSIFYQIYLLIIGSELTTEASQLSFAVRTTYSMQLPFAMCTTKTLQQLP